MQEARIQSLGQESSIPSSPLGALHLFSKFVYLLSSSIRKGLQEQCLEMLIDAPKVLWTEKKKKKNSLDRLQEFLGLSLSPWLISFEGWQKL